MQNTMGAINMKVKDQRVTIIGPGVAEEISPRLTARVITANQKILDDKLNLIIEVLRVTHGLPRDDFRDD